MKPCVDIIIPAAPGDSAWRDLLPQLTPSPAQNTILVLATGESEEPAHDAHVRVVQSPRGRARQLNAGASAGNGDWLWFLHADSRLSAKTLDGMRDFVNRNEAAIGYFDLRFLDDGPRLMFVNSFGAFLRSRFLGLPFGDQGLLMPRRVFDALGGFDEAAGKGEDHALIWTARAQGVPVKPLRASIHTSARKYAEHGWWRTTWQHLRMTREQASRFSRRAHAQQATDRS
jgi:rSAM/selenodomain-associated transferase 2